MVQQAAPRLELHDEIDVTLLIRFAAGHGAEDAHIAGPVLGGDLKDLLPLLFQQLLNGHSPAPSGSSKSSRPASRPRPAARAARPRAVPSFLQRVRRRRPAVERRRSDRA